MTPRSIAEIAATWCGSDFEGCMCGHDRDHDGLHECAAENCGCTWTDEQSATWWAELRAEVRADHPDRHPL